MSCTTTRISSALPASTVQACRVVYSSYGPAFVREASPAACSGVLRWILLDSSKEHTQHTYPTPHIYYSTGGRGVHAASPGGRWAVGEGDFEIVAIAGQDWNGMEKSKERVLTTQCAESTGHAWGSLLSPYSLDRRLVVCQRLVQ